MPQMYHDHIAWWHLLPPYQSGDTSRKLGSTQAECSGPYVASTETHQPTAKDSQPSGLNAEGKRSLAPLPTSSPLGTFALNLKRL